MSERAGAAARGTTEPLRLVRSAMRRLRLLLRILPGAERAAPTRELRDALNALDDRLGASRDLDVLLKLLARVRAPAALTRRYARERSRAVAQRRRLLTGRAWERLLASIAAHARNELPRMVEDESLSSLARKRVRRAVRDMRARRWKASARDLHRLHRLRIEIRRVRLLASLFEDDLLKSSAGLVRASHACERALGRAHDADAAIERLEERRARRDLPVLRELRDMRRRAIRKFRKLWPDLLEQARAWS